MASENLDFVRSIFAAWERGDFGSADWADPEIEFVIFEGVNAGSWRGLAAMAQAWRDYLGDWESLRLDVEDYRELDHERVLVRVRRRGRGKATGFDLGELVGRGSLGGVVVHLRNRKVSRLLLYGDGDRALADLGLARETDEKGATT